MTKVAPEWGYSIHNPSIQSSSTRSREPHYAQRRISEPDLCVLSGGVFSGALFDLGTRNPGMYGATYKILLQPKTLELDPPRVLISTINRSLRADALCPSDCLGGIVFRCNAKDSIADASLIPLRRWSTQGSNAVRAQDSASWFLRRDVCSGWWWR